MKGITYWITNEVRNGVAKRDRGVCQYCGKKAKKAYINGRGVIMFTDEKKRAFHIAHRVSVADGGKHTMDNLMLSCHTCNLSSAKKKTANDSRVKKLLKEINGR